MKRPCCLSSTQNQTARIGLIIWVFLDNFPCLECFKHFVHSDQSKGF